DRRSVADLDEVVDLRPSGNARLADGSAVDAGVGLDFDGVFEDRGARLDDFDPAPARALGEAEAVRADDRSILQDDIVAEAAVFADDRMGVGEEAVADG